MSISSSSIQASQSLRFLYLAIRSLCSLMAVFWSSISKLSPTSPHTRILLIRLEAAIAASLSSLFNYSGVWSASLGMGFPASKSSSGSKSTKNPVITSDYTSISCAYALIYSFLRKVSLKRFYLGRNSSKISVSLSWVISWSALPLRDSTTCSCNSSLRSSKIFL